MKPRDIYDAPFISETTDLYCIEYFLNGIETGNEGVVKQTRVKVFAHFDPHIDGTRHASLYSVRFEVAGSWLPVFICKSGGRPDHEYYQRFITSEALFCSMLSYLKSLEVLEYGDIDDLVGMDDVVVGLDKVYGTYINVNDLGPIAHGRHAFYSHHLRHWGSEGGWPYPCTLSSLGELLTQDERQQMRWGRIQSEAGKLAQVDPDSRFVAELAQADVGTDEIVAEMATHIRQLQSKAGK